MAKHKHFHSFKNCKKALYSGRGGLVPRRPRKITAATPEKKGESTT